MNTQRLRVYGWTAIIRQGVRKRLGLPSHIIQARCIIAAASMAEVGRMLNRPPRQLFNLCETGNVREIEVAMETPRVFLVAPLDGSWLQRQYIRVEPAEVG